jgi:CDP-paratose 2-epimerase
MSVTIVTGSGGLIGAEAVRYFAEKGMDVVGIDNDMRKYFFGDDASTSWSVSQLSSTVPVYRHYALDIRDGDGIKNLFESYGNSIATVIHTAAQPSHDWAAREPITDFTINANGTLNLLEATRIFAPEATFIFTSTNKVYGDNPNRLPLVELEDRWEVDPSHAYCEHGIDVSMSLDHCMHSLFGASKAAADLVVQEYGRYFGMNTVCFRGGCLTGSGHSGAELHGFLAYLMKCVVTGTPYRVFGYKGKQVRDNIHSNDLVEMFWHYHTNPRPAAVYNAGGGRYSNCSMLEAIHMCEEIAGRKLDWQYVEENRKGDHIWYISDMRQFQQDYPDWSFKYSLNDTLIEIYDGLMQRL